MTEASRHRARRRAQEYLRQAHLYRLGGLTTERPHPETRDLAGQARRNLRTAISVLKQVDLRALKILELYAAEIDALSAAVSRTLDEGRRVFLCGCGATGRLALTLESLWRERHPGSERVQAFMAGGDIALARALEGFEDHPRYGARHLEQMGFADGDLLIACTEGGETPFVIGATEQAARLSSNTPYFLYCNADSVLAPRIERSRRVLENAAIRKLCLHVGPMALTGSTRMQASTVLQLAVGLALLHRDEPARVWISRLARRLRDTDLSFLSGFIRDESAIYRAGDHVIYRVRDYGITVLTDTTERSPTFSLLPFDPVDGRPVEASLCYVALDGTGATAEAWTRLLNRAPRALDWPEIDGRTTAEYLQGFDFSSKTVTRRRERLGARRQHELVIRPGPGGIELRFMGRREVLPTAELPALFRHLLLKLALNMHSTLVMGRLGRYENNLMTWVLPTNGKLVDRAARYVKHLLTDAGHTAPAYERIVRQLFVEMERAEPGESVVLRTFGSLTAH